MLIEELLRTCANRSVANAAISSIGHRFAGEIEARARTRDVAVGDYVSDAVSRFARSGDEAAMRSVVSAMNGAQEPILAGLHRILQITLVKAQRGQSTETVIRVLSNGRAASKVLGDDGAVRDADG